MSQSCVIRSGPPCRSEFVFPLDTDFLALSCMSTSASSYFSNAHSLPMVFLVLRCKSKHPNTTQEPKDLFSRGLSWPICDNWSSGVLHLKHCALCCPIRFTCATHHVCIPQNLNVVQQRPWSCGLAVHVTSAHNGPASLDVVVQSPLCDNYTCMLLDDSYVFIVLF